MIRRVTLAVCLGAMTTATCAPETRQPSPTEPPTTTTTTTIPATTTTTISAGEAAAAFRDCLEERGVQIAEIPLDSRGRPRLELVLPGVDFSEASAVEALAECSEVIVGGPLDLSVWPDLGEAVRANLSGFSECVRAHGVTTFPDPVGDFDGLGSPYPPEEIPFDDPGLEGAVGACARALAEGGS